MDLNRLFRNFEILQTWEEKYRFIIELGKKNEKMDPSLKTEENRVRGCVSTVHLVVLVSESEGQKIISFIAESDALIVNGLVAILKILINHKTIEEINALDIDSIFEKLGLKTHLSPNRRNGFFSMVEKIRQAV